MLLIFAANVKKIAEVENRDFKALLGQRMMLGLSNC